MPVRTAVDVAKATIEFELVAIAGESAFVTGLRLLGLLIAHGKRYPYDR